MGEISNPGLQQDDFDLSQFYGVFFEEARENLANMESMLVDIDVAQPTDEELNAIFRVAHSIKGGAATLGVTGMASLAQQLEQETRQGGAHERIVELAKAMATGHAALKSHLAQGSAAEPPAQGHKAVTR